MSQSWSRQAAVLLIGAGIWACKSEEPVQYPEEPPKDYTADAGAAPSDAAVDDAARTDAGPGPLNSIDRELLEKTIDKRARKDQRGGKALGDLLGGTLQEGGTLTSDITMQPDKCYGVVAAGASGVVELDIQITASPATAPPGLAPVIAVDNTGGNVASITPCYENVFPVPIPAQVVVEAKRGTGGVAAKVFEK